MIGELIRIERAKKGYSQEYMAFMLDISQSTYSKLESESLELNIKRLYQIAEILDVNVYDVLPPSKQSAMAAPNFFLKIWIRMALFLRKKSYQTTHSNG
nr:helix-turn-helix transcriptional regulator [Pseudopedobacter sp.]